MLVKDLSESNYTYYHEFEFTIEDNYSVDVWVRFTSFEIVDALKKDSRFKWLSDYDLLDEESFCLKFESIFIDLNSELIASVAEESPNAYKAHW
jgi:hypothetical protein